MSHIADAIITTGQAIFKKLQAVCLARPKKTGAGSEMEEKKQAEGKALKKARYSVGTENLAVPETHTGKIRRTGRKKEKPAGGKNKKPHIRYESLALPEIHFKKKEE